MPSRLSAGSAQQVDRGVPDMLHLRDRFFLVCVYLYLHCSSPDQIQHVSHVQLLKAYPACVEGEVWQFHEAQNFQFLLKTDLIKFAFGKF